MNSRAAFARQLHAELTVWVAQGWISAAQAERLGGQYPLTRADGRQGWQILLSVLAALCIGGGVIALFAANWHELTRPMRVALSLAPLLLSQGAYLFGYWRRPHSASWREAATLAVALAVGASIALIAQTYHIESEGRFLHIWLCLILPLPYLTASWTSAFFAAFLIHVWAVLQTDIFIHPLFHVPWQYFAYLAALLPWTIIRAKSAPYAEQALLWRIFVNAQAMATLVILFMLHPTPLSALLSFAAAYLVCRAWCGSSVMGMFFAFVLGIVYLWLGEMRFDRDEISLSLAYNVPLLIAVLWRWRRVRAWEWAFACGGLLLYGLSPAVILDADVPVQTMAAWRDARLWMITAAIIMLGIWQLRLALEDERYLAINAAFIWILAALYWRFMDAEIPLWVKGIAFILAGVTLFALNRYVARRHKGAPR